MSHDYRDLIRIFNLLFKESHRTVLVKGGDEPIYLPARNGEKVHRLVFAHGYFASALHETAHWCIAGRRRRRLEDFGYWYVPDGRNGAQQQSFLKVEVKPQALEWIFSMACGFVFRFSTDNLSGEDTDAARFTASVRQRAERYLEKGLPDRASQFVRALTEFYGTGPRFGRPFLDEHCGDNVTV